MKALFLAGGKGMRLKPLTDIVSKPMIPIMNKPLLERMFLNLKENGITDVIISSCYRPYDVENYFDSGEAIGMNIKYIVEDFPLGTGGAVKNAEKFLTDTFIVLNSDIISDIKIKQMYNAHKNNSAMVTIAITEVENPLEYGVVEFDNNGYVESFSEKPNKSELSTKFINAGVYICEKNVLNYIPDGEKISLENNTFQKLTNKKNEMIVFKSNGYWIDIGTPEKYIKVHNDLLNNKCNLVSLFNKDNIILGEDVKIHKESKIIGPVFIGNNVTIGANAVIKHSVIGDNVSIAAGSNVINSVLWNNINIDVNVKLIKSIVSSNCIIKKDLHYINSIFTAKTN